MTKRWRMLGALAWRESRSARKRLLVYMSSISLGVAALVAVDSFAANVETSIHEQSRELLGGDLAIRAGQPYSDETAKVLDSLQQSGITVARSANFVSMGLVPRTTGTRLVQVRAVSDSFPLFGVVETAPAGKWAELQGGARAIVDPALLASLKAVIGDSLQLGFGRFEIIGTLVRVPGDPGVTAAIGPRVMVPAKYLEQTQLLGFGSRAEYEAFFRLPPGGDQRDMRNQLRERLETDSARIRVRTAADTEENLTEAIQRLSDYLGIVGLIALLLGGIGVASGVHAFVVAKIDTAAVLRCLGASGMQVMVVYIAQAASMGLVGAAAGVVLGIAIQFAMPLMVADFLPITVAPTLAARAIGMGFLAGAEVAIVFALLPLLALRHVSPLQALRRETDEDAARSARRTDLPQIIVIALAASSVVGIAVARSERASDGVFIAGGVMAVLAVLWMAAALLIWGARRTMRAGWPYVVRQGVANLYRPSNQTRPVVLALGFGVFLVTTLALLEANLLRRFTIGMEASRGNLLFYDVQADQTTGVDSLIAAGQIEVVQRTPIVTMRIAAINGVTADELAPRGPGDDGPGVAGAADSAATLAGGSAQDPAGRGQDAGGRGQEAAGRGQGQQGNGRRPTWPIRREYRSTYRAELLSTEPIIAGRALRSPTQPGELNEASFEQEVADELGLELGDTVTWNVSGVTIPTVITSFREVNWARFEPNFFAILTPPALEQAPQMFVYILRVPDGPALGALQRAVVERYPNVSSVDLTLVQETVAGIMNRASLAIQFLAFFGVIMGVPVLLSAVAATRRARVRDGVLLRILGATRAQIRKILLAEYIVLGLLGTLAGVLLATGAAWALMHFIFDDRFALAPVAMLGLGLGMSALTAVIGVVTGRDVFAAPPAVAMRES